MMTSIFSKDDPGFFTSSQLQTDRELEGLLFTVRRMEEAQLRMNKEENSSALAALQDAGKILETTLKVIQEPSIEKANEFLDEMKNERLGVESPAVRNHSQAAKEFLNGAKQNGAKQDTEKQEEPQQKPSF